MKRTELHRRAPLAAGAPLARPRTPRWGKSKRKQEADNAFRDLRPQVITREDGCCALCGREAPLEVHHRLRRGAVDRERLSNLGALCRSCHHDEVHAKPNWARVNGWILGEHQSPPLTLVKYRSEWRYLDDDGSTRRESGCA